MNKSEFVQSIAESSKITKAEAEAALNAVQGALTEVLKQRQSVTLAGFGTFDVAERGARKGRNPRTGETIDIAPSSVPRFRPGAQLKKAVNGS
jgi:DNA-binding protein HU-beta